MCKEGGTRSRSAKKDLQKIQITRKRGFRKEKNKTGGGGKVSLTISKKGGGFLPQRGGGRCGDYCIPCPGNKNKGENLRAPEGGVGEKRKSDWTRNT